MAAQVTLLETTSPVALVDLFALDVPVQSSYEKRPCIDNYDLDVICLCARLIEQEALKHIMRELK